MRVLHPGFPDHHHGRLAENPAPSRDEAVEMIAGNLCRCTGYQNIVDAVLRAAECSGRPSRERAADGLPLHRQAHQPGRGSAADHRQRPLHRRHRRRHRRLEVAFVRSPHAHARIGEIDVTDALDVEGVVAIYTYEDLEGPAAEPLPVLIPHPSLHAPRTGYALAKAPSITSGSRSSWWWPRAVTWLRMPLPGSPSTTRSCRPWWESPPPGRRNTPCTRTSRTTSPPIWSSRSAMSTPR